jgi:hypothetical protein
MSSKMDSSSYPPKINPAIGQLASRILEDDFDGRRKTLEHHEDDEVEGSEFSTFPCTNPVYHLEGIPAYRYKIRRSYPQEVTSFPA